jgi:hypothetical protein
MIVSVKIVSGEGSDISSVTGSGFLPMGRLMVNISVSANNQAKAMLINKQHIIAANMVYLLSD